MNSLKISSFNTRGLLNTKKWRLNWEKQGEVIFNHSHSQGGGLTILLKNKINNLQNTNIIPGRMQKIKFILGKNKIIVFNVHAPNTDKDQIEFFKTLHDEISNDNEHDILILAGDFNIVIDVGINKKNGNKTIKKSVQNIKTILDDNYLIDVWRRKNPRKKCLPGHKKTTYLMPA